jgi:protein subunit release factor A
MQLWIGNIMTEFENSATGLEMLLQAIEEAVNSSGLILSHLLVDEVAVYDEYWDYLETNLANIQKIKVELQSISELMQDILQSTILYLERSLYALEKLAESFYSEVNSDTWQDLSDFLEGLQWLAQSIEMMDEVSGLADIVADYEQWNRYSKAVRELQPIVAELEEPLQHEDYVSVGDILLYEVIPRMQELLTKIPSIK